nr:hypothetical protein [Tanacetum cinerariifolium]
MYLKKAQSEKPCLYEIPYDTFELAYRFIPDREETLNLEKEIRSKLNKDLVKPYDYTKQNSLYENFKPASQEYHDQLAHANEIVQPILFIVDSGYTKHITDNLKLLCNFVEKYLGTVLFANDQFAPILGHGDLVQGNIMINRVYYVEGLNHNLFSVADTTFPTQRELELLFGPLYDKFFNAGTSVNKSSSPTDNSKQQDTPPTTNIQSPLEPTTPTNEEVCGAQPNRFVDPDHPEKVYHLREPLYGLKQAPRTWYDELSNFLMSKGFTKGTINPTLFTIRYGEDILLVQIYVDDIIFRSTIPKRYLYQQAKYALEILKKHGMDKCDTVGTLMASKPKLDADLSGKLVDQTDYQSKIGSLMYLTSSRPDIAQADCTAMSSAEAEYVALAASCAQQLADMFTNALPKDKFQYLVRRIGMRCLTPVELEVLANESA